MKTSRLIERTLTCALLLAAGCGESHVLEADDFEQTGEPVVADAAVGGNDSQRDSGAAGGTLGGLLDPDVLDDLLGGILNGGPGGAPMGPGARDAGPASMPDAGSGLCARLPQLPTCARDGGAGDGGARDGGSDGGARDGGSEAGVDAGDAGGADTGADAGAVDLDAGEAGLAALEADALDASPR